MTQVLGHQPALRRLALIDGQDFVEVFEATGGALPVGSTVALEMLNRDRDYSYGLWPATFDDGWVASIDAADHAVVPHGSWFRLWATYPGSGGRHCWIAGPVERNRR